MTTKENNESHHNNRFVPGLCYRVIGTDIIFKFVKYTEDSSLLFEGVCGTEHYCVDPENGYYPFSWGSSLEEV